MYKDSVVITGLGVITSSGVGTENLKNTLYKNFNTPSNIKSFSTESYKVKKAFELKEFDPSIYFPGKNLRNFNRHALFLLVASKLALEQAKIQPNEKNTDSIGVCCGTSFSHLIPVIEFDREVYKEGIEYASPSFFPFTTMNSVSSLVAIFFFIRGFNTTITSGYTSCLEALKYGILSLESDMVERVLVCCVEALTYPIFLGFYRLGYLAGLDGSFICCPYDKRRNGPVLGEAAVALIIEKEKSAKKRKAKILARVNSISTIYKISGFGRLRESVDGPTETIKSALSTADLQLSNIDYISGCADSSKKLDYLEVKALKNIFQGNLKKIPISSVKSIFGETFSASSGLQIASSIVAFENNLLPPTINYKLKDPDCDIDCIPNKPQEKNVDTILVNSFGPGGYAASCVLSKS